MNIKELIKKYEYLNHNYFRRVDTSEVLRDLKQLDEPQKVTIPQFVADWYEKRKNNIDFEIWHYLHTFDSQKEDEFKKWMNKLGKKQIQTLINMHQFGYEVEKEKRYFVKIRATKHCFTKDGNGRIFFSLAYKSCFTQTELEKAGFGWVFDCEGIEVKEVEE